MMPLVSMTPLPDHQHDDGRNWRRPIAMTLACLAALAATAASAQPPQRQQPQAPPAEDGATESKDRYWTTRWNFEEVDIGQLVRRLKSFGVDLGVEAEGAVTANFTVGIPLTSLRDAQAYRLRGRLVSSRLVVDGLELRDLQTELELRNGVATLSTLRALVVTDPSDPANAGRIEGRGDAALAPRGDATAKLRLDRVDLQPFVDLANKFAGGERNLIRRAGQASGQVSFRAPVDEIRRVESYELTGELAWQGVQVGDLPPADIDIEQVALERGRLKVTSMNFQTARTAQSDGGIRLTGDADLPLAATGGFTFNLAGDDLPLAAIAGLATGAEAAAPAVARGKIDLRLRGRGELAARLADSKWLVEGAVASPALEVGGMRLGKLEHQLQFTPSHFELLPLRAPDRLPDAFLLRAIQSDYQISRDALVVRSLDAQVFGGRVAGDATLSFDPARQVALDLTISNLRPVMKAPVAGRLSAPISATIAGKINWRAPRGEIAAPRAHRGTANLTLQEIRVGQELVGELNAELTADSDNISLRFAGDLFGGTIEGETVADAQAAQTWPDLSRRLRTSKIEINGVSWGPLLKLATGRKLGLSGEATGELELQLDPASGGRLADARGALRLGLANVRYGRSLLSRNLAMRGVVDQGVLTLESLAGEYAGGTARLGGRLYLLNAEGAFRPRADLIANLSRVRLDRGLAMVDGFQEDLSGRISGQATIAGDLRSIRIRGRVAATDLVAYEVAIGSAHSGVIASFNPQTFSWRARLPNIGAGVGGGRLEADLSLASNYGRGVNLQSRWRAKRVDFARLTNQLGQTSSIARGEISGDLTLDGKSVRSVNDLTGRFDFQLGETRGAAVPGLTAASRLLGPVSLATESFDAGQARGLIGRGAVRLQEFWLSSDSALVRADGKVYLASRRMDLEAIIATGDYGDIASDFAQLAQANALRAILPASAILSVSELLRDRTVVVAVTGTTERPIVRLRTVETFREEVARFFLREGQRLILAGFAVGAVDGLDGGF